MTGIERIAAERQRQIDEHGWTAEKDDEQRDGELAAAAAAYAFPPQSRGPIYTRLTDLRTYLLYPESWSLDWWKPSPENRIRELEKAGALIAAEIDRLMRLEESQ